MLLKYGLNEYISEADNIYDLIANCFSALYDNISNHQEFISIYLGEADCEQDSEDGCILCNPNIDRLNKFSEQLMAVLTEYKVWDYPEIQKNIFDAIGELELQTYRDEKQNQLTVIYCILASIDSVAMSWQKKWMSKNLGPLDKQRKTSFRVYFNLGRTLHEEYINNVHRNRVMPSSFLEEFQSFRFINEAKWEKEGIPLVKYFTLPRKFRADFEKMRSIRIAVIPVSCKENFRFVSAGGSGKKVDYSKHDQKQLGKKICYMIEAAVQAECNLIVFPEYTISPEIYEEIRRQLNKSHGKLLFVFAGTTWTEDNNNVMRILDSWGELIGEYYKYTPFTQKEKGKHGFKIWEALASPGKICDIIAIENIGIFLPSICRDMIDDDYTSVLSKALLPLFVIISAYSKSVASFEQRQSELANKYFISSVLGNACSAVAKSADKIGNGSIVHKTSTIAGVKIKGLERNQCNKDEDCKGCYYILDYDFMFGDNKNTEFCISRYQLE